MDKAAIVAEVRRWKGARVAPPHSDIVKPALRACSPVLEKDEATLHQRPITAPRLLHVEDFWKQL